MTESWGSHKTIRVFRFVDSKPLVDLQERINQYSDNYEKVEDESQRKDTIELKLL